MLTACVYALSAMELTPTFRGFWLQSGPKFSCMPALQCQHPALDHVTCCIFKLALACKQPDHAVAAAPAAAAGTRKLEIFARKHNVRPGWVSLGNQLDGTWLTDPELAARYAQRYGPADRPRKPPPPRMTAPEYSTHFAREYGGDWTFGRHD
jgi:hypothetical protein